MQQRKRLLRFLPIAVLLGGALVALTADLRAPRPQRAPRLLQSALVRGELRAGAGRVELSLPADTVLAGYRAFGRSGQQAGPPLHARALVVEVEELRVGLLLLELLTLPEQLVATLRERAAAHGIDCLWVAPTHTHSGPGGYEREFLQQLALGRFDPRVEAALVDASLSALAAARAELAPATFSHGESRWSTFARNRDRKGEPWDDRATLLRFDRRDGRPIARVLRYSAHPTINPRRIGPDGDWPGFLMDFVEESGGIAFALQGAVGDVRPLAREGKGGVRTVLYAEQVAAALRELPLGESDGRLALGCSAVELDLPPADLRAMVGRPFGTLASNAAAPFAPGQARVEGLRLGDLLFLGIPAETTWPVAERIENEAAFGLQPRIVSPVGAYVGYTPERREVEKRRPSARNAWFGEALAPRIVEAAKAAAAPLGTAALAGD